jgi:ribosomal protein S18 acetylase RimI-like enzyme
MRTELRTATVDDADAMAAVLADAFFDDPLFGWLFPDPSGRPRVSQAMFAILGRHLYLGRGESLCGPDVAGFWEPPDAGGDDDLWAEHGAELAAAVEGQVERLGLLGEAMAAHHPPDPCWYLPMLGVRPGAQGRGLGGELLAHKLAQIDAVGGAAYLEASSPRSRGLYERHGFELVEEFAAEGSPPLWAMWRAPR